MCHGPSDDGGHVDIRGGSDGSHDSDDGRDQSRDDDLSPPLQSRAQP